MSAAVIEAMKAAVGKLDGTGDLPGAGARRAAVAVLLRGASMGELEVLLMRRAIREGDRWSGQIGLPGGHEEDFDASLESTARRESLEEVGVDPGGSGGNSSANCPPSRRALAANGLTSSSLPSSSTISPPRAPRSAPRLQRPSGYRSRPLFREPSTSHTGINTAR